MPRPTILNQANPMECAAYGTEHHGKSAIEPCKLTATTTTVPRIRRCLSCTSICGEATLVFRLHANLHTGICTRSLFDPEFLTDRWQHAAAEYWHHYLHLSILRRVINSHRLPLEISKRAPEARRPSLSLVVFFVDARVEEWECSRG